MTPRMVACLGALGAACICIGAEVEKARVDALSRGNRILPAETRDLLTSLESGDRHTSRKARDDLLQQQHTLVDGLFRITERLAIAEASQSAEERDDGRVTSARRHCIEALANIAPHKSLPLLVRDVDFQDSAVVIDGYHPLNTYPCAMALQRIGRASELAIVEKLYVTTPRDLPEMKIDLFAEILLGITSYPSANPRFTAFALMRRHASRRPNQNVTRVLLKMEEKLKVMYPKGAPPGESFDDP